MAANAIRLKRSSTPGYAPNPTALQDGEVAINVSDGVLYFRQFSNNTASLVSLRNNQLTNGSNTLTLKSDGTVSVNNNYSLPATNGTAGQTLVADGLGGVSWSKIYADAIVSSTQPANPISGLLWYSTNTASMYIYANGTWVATGSASGSGGGTSLTNGLYSTNLNSNGTLSLPLLTAAPVNPQLGQVALADGINWDPSSNKASNPYLIVYSGTAWVQIGGLTHTDVYKDIINLG